MPKARLLFPILFLMAVLHGSPLSAQENARLVFQTGIGSLDYEESTDAFGTHIESESSSRIFLLEGLGELFLSEDIYAAGLVTAGWTSADEERWSQNGIPRQINDLQVDLYNLELRLGYRFPLKRDSGFTGSIYLNTGYDTFNFTRSNFVVLGVPQPIPTVTEEFNLLRLGTGFLVVKDLDRWSFHGELGYDRYFDGDVRNSAFPGITLETEGDRWQLEIGAARSLSSTLSLGLAARFLQVDLEESDPVSGIIFPDSRTEINSINLILTKEF